MGGSDFLESAQLPFRASTCDHLGPRRGGQLNTTSPHTTCCAKNQYFLTRLNRSTRLHHAKCRTVSNRERSCIDKGQPVRHSQKICYRHREQLAARSGKSLACHSPALNVWVGTNAITKLPGAAVHGRPQNNDFSREVTSRAHRKRGLERGGTLKYHRVKAVQRNSPDSNQDFIWGRSRSGYLVVLEVFNAAVGMKDDCFHSISGSPLQGVKSPQPIYTLTNGSSEPRPDTLRYNTTSREGVHIPFTFFSETRLRLPRGKRKSAHRIT